jgi:small conductance mechanosensitive channel
MGNRRIALLCRIAAVAALLAGGLTIPSTSVSAQSFPGLPLATPAPSNPALDALYATAPITLDGITLFQLAVPVTQNTTNPVAVRANAVSDALDEVLATTEQHGETETVYEPQTLHIEIVRDNGQTVLEAVDAHHTTGVIVVTVTSADAEYAASSIEGVAQEWQSVLQTNLVRALTIRQPANQRRTITTVAIVAAVLVILTVIAILLSTLFTRRIAALTQTLAARNAQVDAPENQPESPDDPASHERRRARLLGVLARRVDPEKQQTLYRALRLMTISIAVLAWVAGISWALLQFPQTAAAGVWLLRNFFGVAAIWIGALVVDRLLTITVDRLPTLWELRAFGAAEDSQRQLLRAPTIARALGGLKSVIIIFVALLATMTQIGIPVGSVVTLGGLAAIGVSLAAQNLIRDVLSGFLILIEDQFVVGDLVTINGSRGSVERLTLRMVQIRDVTGSLITLSNSAATVVINHSRNWARVDYEIPIDIAADVPFAISLLQKQIAELQSDPEWKSAIAEPAEWIGIDALSRDGAVVRARIKAAPLRQYALRRELNERVAKAFAEAKIGYGAPLPPEA